MLGVQDQTLVDNLCKFIKYNFKLYHLDLSHTGLTTLMLREFGSSLRRAKSLLSLHLNGNPGLSSALKAEMHQRVHCAESEETISLNVISSNLVKKTH